MEKDCCPTLHHLGLSCCPISLEVFNRISQPASQMGWSSGLALESMCLGFANLPLVSCFSVSPALLASAANWAVIIL